MATKTSRAVSVFSIFMFMADHVQNHDSANTRLAATGYDWLISPPAALVIGFLDITLDLILR